MYGPSCNITIFPVASGQSPCDVIHPCLDNRVVWQVNFGGSLPCSTSNVLGPMLHPVVFILLLNLY